MIGQKLGSYILGNKIVVGYDSRYSSKSLIKHLVLGLKKSRCSIINIGMCSSPMMNFAHKHFNSDYGIIVTASHNPINYNGFKIIKNNIPIDKNEMHKIFSMPFSKEYSQNKFHIIKKNILNIYIAHLIENNKNSQYKKKLKIVWDTGKCVASKIINKLIKCLKYHENIHINNVIDNYSIADNSEIKNLSALIKKIKSTHSDVGFYFDTDADRISVIDHNGKIIHTDTLMMMLIQDLIDNNQKCNNVIIDYKTSTKVIEYLEKSKIKHIFSRTGHSFIRQSMSKNNTTLAGECSGHIFYGKNGYDDGIYIAIKIINILSYGKNFSDFPEIYITSDIRVNVKDNLNCLKQVKQKILKDNLNYIDIHDGVKVILEYGWWIFRCSGTENKIVIRAEGTDNFNLIKTQEHMKKYIILDNEDWFKQFILH